MAVLAGLERANGGNVCVAGLDFATMDEDDLARARRGRIGIVLQAFHLLPTMTALENVAVPLELAGIADPFGRAAAELEAVGLGHRLTHYPAQLSGGEQQRVAIARAMASSPAIIFADEPTGNLDTATGQAIIELIFARRAALGATWLIITYDPELAGHCDRVVVMHDGKIEERAAQVLPLATLWRIARRDLATRIRGLRLLAVCLFLGVATLAAIGSLTRGITSELEVRRADDPWRRRRASACRSAKRRQRKWRGSAASARRRPRYDCARWRTIRTARPGCPN